MFAQNIWLRVNSRCLTRRKWCYCSRALTGNVRWAWFLLFSVTSQFYLLWEAYWSWKLELADALSRGFYTALPQITATSRCVGSRGRFHLMQSIPKKRCKQVVNLHQSDYCPHPVWGTCSEVERGARKFAATMPECCVFEATLADVAFMKSAG